jgi:hypothetical protein
MERVNSRRFWVPAAGLLLLLPTTVSRAGTVLVNSQTPDDPVAEAKYPESRFGQPPAKVDLGLGPSYVKHAVSELDPIRDEADEPKVRNTTRRPAGLEFTPDTRSHDQGYRSNPAYRMAKPEALKSDSPINISEPSPGTIVRGGVQEVAVIASDLGYFPRTLFVTRDLPVRLYVTGSSKNTLCIMMDSFQVRKQVRSQKIEEITFTPNVPGKYRFYCPVNGMEGTLIVKEYSSGIVSNEIEPGEKTAWGSSTSP